MVLAATSSGLIPAVRLAKSGGIDGRIGVAVRSHVRLASEDGEDGGRCLIRGQRRPSEVAVLDYFHGLAETSRGKSTISSRRGRVVITRGMVVETVRRGGRNGLSGSPLPVLAVYGTAVSEVVR